VKKFILLLLFIFISFSVFAYNYPSSFSELMKQFEEEKQKIEIIVDDVYRGWVIVAQADYCVFKLDNNDVIIIVYLAIKEVSLL